MPTGIVAVPARIVLLLLLPLPALGEPGPNPHEYRLDRNGHPLPTGAIARLGIRPPLSGFAWTLGWTADGSRFVVVDYSGVTVFDAATGRWVESQAIGTGARSLYTPLSRDGRLLFLLNGRTGAQYDTATADIRTFTLPAPFGDADRKVYSLTLSANCRFLAGIAAPTSNPGIAWRYDLAHDRFARILTFALAPGKPLDIPVAIARRGSMAKEIEVIAEGSPAGVAAAVMSPMGKVDPNKVTLRLTTDKPGPSGAFRIVGRSKEPALSRAAKASLADFETTTSDVWLAVGGEVLAAVPKKKK